MRDVLLTINAGPSSIKFAIFRCEPQIQAQPELTGRIGDIGDGRRACLTVENKDGRLIEGSILPLDGRPDRARLDYLVRWLRKSEFDRRIVGVGHRVVHGGWRYSRPVILDEVAVGELRDSILLAPLHQSYNLDAIEVLRQAFPPVPQVACFDTDFHRQSGLAPPSGHCQGFHGLSYEYVADVLPDYLGAGADGRVIVAHLGDSTSLCAMRGRRSLAATTNFLAEDFVNESGLDARNAGDPATSDKPDACAAMGHFCYRIVREIGSLAAAIGGVDALVFTGAGDERMARVPSHVGGALRWLGVDLDTAANDSGAVRITRGGSKVGVLVLPANEEWIVARHTAERLRTPAPA